MIELLANPAHVHLLLNHVPTVGFGLALVIFFVAYARRNDDLKRTGLVIFFAVAVVAIATYMSGGAAESVVQGRPGVSQVMIRAHEDAALLAFVFMEITGFFAWLALWQWRRMSQLAGWNLPTVLILSIVTFGLMARAAEVGGEIRHPEIRSARAAPVAEPATGPGTGIARSIGLFVEERTWVWPTSETLHFVGLSMLFTVVLIVDLRMLGMVKSVSYSAVYQLLPIGMLGFGINLVTGMLFFLGNPQQYIHNTTFYWKMVFVVLGGLNVLYFMLEDEVWAVGPGDDAPLTSKIAAASAIFLWVAVLFCGHMLPFLGNSF
jgi:uncharacterized membrane protein